MRLGCLLTTAALLVSLVVEPPKAKAFAVTSSAVSALAGGFLNACGLAPVVSGMGSSSEVNESVARLLQDYLNTEVGGQSILEWAGDLALSARDGKLIISKLLVDKLAQFASWVASKYATKPGEEAVTPGMYPVYSNQSIKLMDGTSILLSVVDFNSSQSYPYNVYFRNYTLGSVFGQEKVKLDFAPGYSMLLYIDSDRLWQQFTIGGVEGGLAGSGDSASVMSHISLVLNEKGCLEVGFVYSPSTPSQYSSCYVVPVSGTGYYFPPSAVSLFDISGVGLSFNVSETVQQILDRLTALEEGQAVALDVGATQSMEIQEILQGILDAILAGNLAATAEIVDEAAVPVDPPAETLPDVDGLGLPALGAALTSRFPFSIPWDVYKGISLLAAPAKAPYFEVDFMAPIADEVGGWKGSTKIVLDFSEFEIIGQVCRWTSTIGFCLMLATATKRLIWTA